MLNNLTDNPWTPPPPQLVLADQAVHLWRLRLDRTVEEIEALSALLNHEERERAERYVFSRDRISFISRRGILRKLLSEYLDLPAPKIQLSFNKFGKPHLEPEASLDFNLSHSAGLAVFAFSRSAAVGVDIEQWRADFDLLKLAEHYFSEVEVQALKSLPGEDRIAGFYAGWTRKEAFIKAHGEGLSLPLDLFDVSLLPGEQAGLLATRGGLEPADQWTMKDIEIDPGFSAALVVRGKPLEYHYWEVVNPITRGRG
jgi:4'-phosphopantetheinyl transferase